MAKIESVKILICASIAALCIVQGVLALDFNIPGGDLRTALDKYAAQTGLHLLYAEQAMNGVETSGVHGAVSADDALLKLLRGTGFTAHPDDGSVAIVRNVHQSDELNSPIHVAVTAAPAASSTALETVTVTSSKIGGDVQNIPISITALSQEQLTQTQTAGGPDLVKQVPNMTFTKTNFSGYSIQLRGIGTQAISVTTDPAVAVAFNDIPFIRNHFFEQEFYDVSQVEVLRGPQGTLYGRNATAGVVNLISAKPSEQFEAMLSLEVGNYGERRPEGMINIPIVDDRLDIRVAGEWTKRQGYSFNTINDQRVDGRDLWSGRVSIGWKPFEDVQTNLVWEHFSESDDRMRTSKQLCETAPNPTEVNGVPVAPVIGTNRVIDPNGYLNQGCLPTSLYSPSAFEVPNGDSLAYYQGFAQIGAPIQGGDFFSFDPYANTTQSRNLRVIETHLNPVYRAKNDTVELNTDYKMSPALTFTSQTGFNNDFLWSTEDYNRFDTVPGAFAYCDPNNCFNGSPNSNSQLLPDPNGQGRCQNAHFDGCTAIGAPCVPTASNGLSCELDGVFCDPQLGCSDRLVAEDLSDEHAWQLSQEFRLTSNFGGPFNFSVGGNYLHYETEENYYVFINTFTLTAVSRDPSGGVRGLEPVLPYVPGVTDNVYCLKGGLSIHNPFTPDNPQKGYCKYVDPNPLTKLNNQGHNYFLSQNPYVLNSYAAFGEAYYSVLSDLKLTTGLRWTEDQKHFTDIPSELFVAGYGYASTGVVNQQWDQLTGRAAVNWTPKLDFTDQTLIYGSYAHGYKAGGANPPGAVLLENNRGGEITNPVHPLTFKPEFVDAFELGTKNTLLDGALTFNADVFYYNYENYQISEIVDRTSINLNFDTHVKGAEIESSWEPVPGLRFNFAGGWEDTKLAKGDQAVDLMDRADLANHPDWMVVKPFVTQASNCVLPTYVVAEMLLLDSSRVAEACTGAYGAHVDPVTNVAYVANPTFWCDASSSDCGGGAHQPISGYAGFDPASAPNNGAGFDKNLSGNELPNAPPFTVSFGAQYTLPLSTDWAGTARSDFYWQDNSWARVFNDNPYDRLHGYTNLNLTLIFTNQNGWQVMLFDKNVFNTTAITGDFLNSDDSALTTNVFLTDPKLIGIRVTKNW
jgi:outer membrane receptor protein involved in Fe transport